MMRKTYAFTTPTALESKIELRKGTEYSSREVTLEFVPLKSRAAAVDYYDREGHPTIFVDDIEDVEMLENRLVVRVKSMVAHLNDVKVYIHNVSPWHPSSVNKVTKIIIVVDEIIKPKPTIYIEEGMRLAKKSPGDYIDFKLTKNNCYGEICVVLCKELNLDYNKNKDHKIILYKKDYIITIDRWYRGKLKIQYNPTRSKALATRRRNRNVKRKVSLKNGKIVYQMEKLPSMKTLHILSHKIREQIIKETGWKITSSNGYAGKKDSLLRSIIFLIRGYTTIHNGFKTYRKSKWFKDWMKNHGLVHKRPKGVDAITVKKLEVTLKEVGNYLTYDNVRKIFFKWLEEEQKYFVKALRLRKK